MCAEQGRRRHLYTSVSNAIYVQVISPQGFARRGQFLIHYQGELGGVGGGGGGLIHYQGQLKKKTSFIRKLYIDLNFTASCDAF